MIRRRLLSPLGRHVFDLLQRPASEWSLEGSTLRHCSGLSLCMVAGLFDVNDRGPSDFVRELGWIDRRILHPMALDVRSALKLQEITK